MTFRPALPWLFAALPLMARHPLARPEYDRGIAHPDMRLERMILVLQPDPERQQALQALLEAQQDPESPAYQQWLTPEQFGEQFGVAPENLERAVVWLEAQGFAVEPPESGRRALVFSGTAGQVQKAFRTEIHAYNVRGMQHYANSREPEMPRQLAGVVHGIASLHDFQLESFSMFDPQWTVGNTHYLSPKDFATIYNVTPLYAQGIDGAGQSIAVIGRTNINPADVRSFRSRFGLPAQNPDIILNGPDPGLVSTGEVGEALLDIEWAGAVARNATIHFVVSASTNTSDGVFLSAQYAVNRNVAPVMTISFGACEAAIGSAANRMINALWQQAAAQGITVLVSSGDSGAAGCDSPSSGSGRVAGVNGLCSSPYSTCVGGTQFMDTANPAAYWSGNDAVGYIPEAVWNQSGIMPGGSGLWATGGGASGTYPRPSWQPGPGAWRMVPDVSLSGSAHDGYLIWMSGQMYAAGGTSASAPAMASLVALLNQKAGARVGNLNPKLYTLAGTAAFHDVTSGGNSVPGLLGVNAGIGYDAATGLGSVDANQLVTRWSAAASSPPPSQPSQCTYTLSPGGASVTASAGGGVLTITTSTGCAWTAMASASWITLAARSGTGSARVSFTIAANTAAQRTATVNVSGQALTVTQAAAPCSYKVDVNAPTPSAAGFAGSATVTSGSWCAWTAAGNATWLTISAGSRGNGNGTVTYKVAANTTRSSRTANVRVADYSFSVTQPAPKATR